MGTSRGLPAGLVLLAAIGAWFLLQQAFIAQEKQGGGDAEFYAAKVETARFFVNQLLPENAWRAHLAEALAKIAGNS